MVLIKLKEKNGFGTRRNAYYTHSVAFKVLWITVRLEVIMLFAFKWHSAICKNSCYCFRKLILENKLCWLLNRAANSLEGFVNIKYFGIFPTRQNFPLFVLTTYYIFQISLDSHICKFFRFKCGQTQTKTKSFYFPTSNKTTILSSLVPLNRSIDLTTWSFLFL